MKKSKYILGSFFLLCSLSYIILKGVLPGWNNLSTDFNNYYVSAKLLVTGEPIRQFYDNDWFYNKAIEIGVENGAKFAPFTPVTAVLYVPLTFWDLLTAKRIWLISNMLLLCFIPFRLSRLFEWKRFDTLLILSLFFVPIASNFNFGQVYLFFSWLIIEAVGANRMKKKFLVPGILIGLLATVKYVPILFLIYIRSKGQLARKALIGSFVAVLTIVILFFYVDSNVFSSFASVFSDHLQGDLSGQGKFAIGFQSIDSMLNNLFVYNPAIGYTVGYESNVLRILFKVLLILYVFVLSILIFKVDQFKFDTVNSSIFIFGAFVLLPASASYHFLFLLLPIFFIVHWVKSNSKQIYLISFISLLLLTFIVQYHHVPDLVNYKSLNIIIHYPRFWGLFVLFSLIGYWRLYKVIPQSK